MEFVFETECGSKAAAAMARALRKTLRKKHSRRSHLFGWIVMVLGLLLSLPIGDRVFTPDLKTVFTYFVILVLFLVLLFEDRLNGYVARKRMLKGTEHIKATFREDGYYSEVEIGNTEWQYDKIAVLAETKGNTAQFWYADCAVRIFVRLPKKFEGILCVLPRIFGRYDGTLCKQDACHELCGVAKGLFCFCLQPKSCAGL